MLFAHIDTHTRHRSTPRYTARWPLLAAGVVLVLTGCASPQPRHVVRQSAPPPSTQVYFYPTRGQSPEQQNRDRYECYLWAVKQTGLDPSDPRLAPHQRVEVVPMRPSGQGTAAGAATGAVLGAVVSPPDKTVQGAVVGAVAGAAIGAASDAARAEQSERVQEQYDRRDAARIERQVSSYRRAMAACLQGRGYSVR